MTHPIDQETKARLLAAEETIRKTRSPRYWGGGDQLAGLWPGAALKSDPELTRLASVDLAAVLDTLYDQAAAEGDASRLRALTEELQRLSEPKQAELHLAGPRPEAPTLLDAAKTVIAGLAWTGTATLTPGGAVWLRRWQGCLLSHNTQQERTNALAMLRQAPEASGFPLEADELRPGGGSFAAGVQQYLARHADSGAGALSLVGCIAFSQALGAERERFLEALTSEPDLLGPISRLLRLAQDTRFDPEEPLNTGVVGWAAEKRLSIPEVLRAGGAPKEQVEPLLRDYWKQHAPRMKAEIAERAAAHQAQPWYPVLTALVAGLGKVADLFAGV